MLAFALLFFLFAAVLMAGVAWLMAGGPQARVVLDGISEFVMAGHALHAFYLLLGLMLLFAARNLFRAGQAGRHWRRFALLRGLQYEPAGWLHPGRIHGEVDGREFELDLKSRQRSLRDNRHEVYTQMKIKMPGAPRDLSVLRRLESGEAWRGLVNLIQEKMGLPADINSGDEDFDRRYSIRSDLAEQVQAWLTPDRRTIIDALTDEPGYFISQGCVCWTASETPFSAAQMELPFQRLRLFADRLAH